MKVSRAQIVYRGLANRCPNCGEHTLFRSGTFFKINPRCPACDFEIQRGGDEGFFLGSMSLNYGITLVAFLAPLTLLSYRGVIGVKVAIIAAGIGSILVPALLYRSSRSWWLMYYYLFFPHHLPANGGRGRAGEDNNL